MINEKKISEFFDELGLGSEEARQRILSQGVVSQEKEDKTVFWIEADNVSNPDKADKSDA